MSDTALTWLGVADLFDGHVPAEGAAVLLVDLMDARLAGLSPLEPTTRDIHDAAKPLAGPRDHFFARRAMLRRLVALRLNLPPEGIVIGHNDDGRPELLEPAGAMHVSVSARGTLAALAVSDLPVGVDLEVLGDPCEPVWDVLHPRERGGIEAIWKTRAEDWPFLSIWTAKEAYLKAIGLGLKREPARIDVRYDSDDIFIVHDPEAQPRECAGATCRGQIGDTPILCSTVVLPS